MKFSPPYFQGGVDAKRTGWFRLSCRYSHRNHPVTCGATPPLHTDVRVSRSARMRESDLENKEGSNKLYNF